MRKPWPEGGRKVHEERVEKPRQKKTNCDPFRFGETRGRKKGNIGGWGRRSSRKKRAYLQILGLLLMDGKKSERMGKKEEAGERLSSNRFAAGLILPRQEELLGRENRQREEIA